MCCCTIKGQTTTFASDLADLKFVTDSGPARREAHKNTTWSLSEVQLKIRNKIPDVTRDYVNQITCAVADLIGYGC